VIKSLNYEKEEEADFWKDHDVRRETAHRI